MVSHKVYCFEFNFARICTNVIPLCYRICDMGRIMTRVVFDRKRQATKKKTGLVQVEVLYQRKRKMISTGVKVYADQWSAKEGVCGRADAAELNERISIVKRQVDDAVNQMESDGVEVSLDLVDMYMTRKKAGAMTFVAWMEERIEQRTDIRKATKAVARIVLLHLRRFGKIVSFADLTRANVVEFDDYLRTQGLKPGSVEHYMTTLKCYVKQAKVRDLIDKDPYEGMRIERSKSEWGRFLTEEELDRLMAAEMKSKAMERARDAFVVQCFTGLSYSDLVSFDFRGAKERTGMVVMSGMRRKTGVRFSFVLLPQAREVLEKYGYEMRIGGVVGYDWMLKRVAAAAGIEKPLASHYARRTCGMILLNRGMSYEVVAKVLGHSNIEITQKAYARLTDDSVAKAFEDVFGNDEESGEGAE